VKETEQKGLSWGRIKNQYTGLNTKKIKQKRIAKDGIMCIREGISRRKRFSLGRKVDEKDKSGKGEIVERYQTQPIEYYLEDTVPISIPMI